MSLPNKDDFILISLPVIIGQPKKNKLWIFFAKGNETLKQL